MDSRPSQRDPRVDLLRGFALLTIFVDHIPGNTLAMFTLRNFGFADAAELFVILSGFSSMAAYGRCFQRDGIGPGLRRIAARCGRLYVFQVGLLLATLGTVKFWIARSGVQLPDFTPFIDSGVIGIKQSLQLAALPPALDILPLYIVLLGFFPLMYLGMRINPALALFASGTLWLAANLHPNLNFTNWLNGQGWFFNPFAWQFLFLIGAVGPKLLAQWNGSLPRIGWLVVLCWAYLAFALLASAPWTTWGVPDLRPFVVPPTDKTNFAPLRALDIVALVYLGLCSLRLRALAEHPWLSGVKACGKHSLEVFSLATLLSLAGRLTFLSFGTGWEIEVVVNGLGLGALLATGLMLDGAMPKIALFARIPDFTHGSRRP